jgi:hypothetical protein
VTGAWLSCGWQECQSLLAPTPEMIRKVQMRSRRPRYLVCGMCTARKELSVALRRDKQVLFVVLSVWLLSMFWCVYV